MQEQLQSFFQNEFQKGLVTANFKKQQPITTENGEYLLIVCYEVAFGSFIASKIDFNRSVAFVLSNDEWIKSLKWKLQHFNFSKLRAIETRKMFVNVTNEGFSGLIDATGNVISIDNVNKASCSFGSIKLLETRTFYAKHGDWLYAASLVLFLVSIMIKLQIKLLTKIIFFFSV